MGGGPRGVLFRRSSGFLTDPHGEGRAKELHSDVAFVLFFPSMTPAQNCNAFDQ